VGQDWIDLIGTQVTIMVDFERLASIVGRLKDMTDTKHEKTKPH
jgi:hypothetical protein